MADERYTADQPGDDPGDATRPLPDSRNPDATAPMAPADGTERMAPADGTRQFPRPGADRRMRRPTIPRRFRIDKAWN